MSKYVGLDYGLGKANVDPNTGLRYGVISINSLHEFVWDELEPNYDVPTCPECGRELVESTHGKDYFCESCAEESGVIDTDGELSENKTDADLEPFLFWSDHLGNDEPINWLIESDDYDAHSSFDNTCLFITGSKYYTFAAYCSPCAPGAGDLDSPMPEGIKTLCFGHDMFTDGKAPYPVYRVSDDSLVEPE